MSFKDIRFPVDISYGSAGGPVYSTTVLSFKSGKDVRNVNWEYPRCAYEAEYGIRRLSQLHDLLRFFHVVQGKAYSFRYKDFMDFRSLSPADTPAYDDVEIGIGDGIETEFQLIKKYNYLEIDAITTQSKNRIITKPVPSSVLIGVNGSAVGSGWSVDTDTGIVTFSVAPTNTHVITAGFEFDVHCNFDTDELSVTLSSYEAGESSVPILERKSLV